MVCLFSFLIHDLFLTFEWSIFYPQNSSFHSFTFIKIHSFTHRLKFTWHFSPEISTPCPRLQKFILTSAKPDPAVPVSFFHVNKAFLRINFQKAWRALQTWIKFYVATHHCFSKTCKFHLTLFVFKRMVFHSTKSSLTSFVTLAKVFRNLFHLKLDLEVKKTTLNSR